MTGSGTFCNAKDIVKCPPTKFLCHYISPKLLYVKNPYSFGHIFTIPLRPKAKSLRTYCMSLTLEHKIDLNMENCGCGKAVFSYVTL